jgi:monomeric sarcosine oxidase
MTMLNSARHYDVAVVGAGVFGAWTAYQLQRDGARTVLIDGYGAGNSVSSSGDDSRIMRMGYGGDEIYSRSAQRSLELWKELFERTEPSLFRKTGVLWLAHEGDQYPVKSFETLTKLGVRVEKLSLKEVRERFPQINLDQISWALFEPDSGVVMARRAVQTVARRAIKLGVEHLREAVDVQAIRHRPNEPSPLEAITTASGRHISASTFVFACGAWLPKIFPDLLGNRIHSTRQEVFYFETPPRDPRFWAPQLPTWIDFKEEAYGLPNLGLGIKVAIDRHGPPFDPDKGDRAVTAQGLAEAGRYLARRLPDCGNRPLNKGHVCQYENTSNGDFLIDRHPEFENVWLVGGGSGHGFKHGPAVAEYVTARIEGRTEGIEPRFSLESKKTTRERAVY